MKKIYNALLILNLVLLSSNGITAQPDRGVASRQTQKRVALVIGNGAYQKTAPLPNPPNDAADMKATLEALGFEVIYGVNQTKEQMKLLIRQFGDKLNETKAVGLVFYAGHGVATGGENFLVPVDADIPREDEIEGASIPLSFLMGKLDAAKNSLNIVILDACRNNPFARSWGGMRDISSGGGLATINKAPSGTLIAYATAPGSTASDGTGRNGLYTQELLAQMRQPNQKIEDVFKNVRIQVKQKSNQKQTPWELSSLDGDFYFAGTTSKDNRPNPNNLNPAAGETAFWQSIESSSEVRDFESYILRSEGGEFAGTYKAVAELKLFRLKKAKAAGVWQKLIGLAVISLKYDRLGAFSDGLAVTLKMDDAYTGKSGLIDRTGREVIPPKYDGIDAFSDGIARVYFGYKNDKGTTYGFINKSGLEVLPVKYYLAEFSAGLMVVYVDQKAGYMDKTGRVIIPAKYDQAEPFSESLAAVELGGSTPDQYGRREKSGKWGFIDFNGREVVPPKYSYVQRFSGGLAAVRNDERLMGYIDETGKEVIPFKYRYANPFSEDLAIVGVGDFNASKYGVIDRTGREIVSPKYDGIEPFSGGLAWFRIGGKWGFIDKTGREVIPPTYDRVGVLSDESPYPRGFSDGMAWVWTGDDQTGKWGLVDKTGRDVMPPKYDSTEAFSKGLALVQIRDGETSKYGFVDRTGREVVTVKYGAIWNYMFRNEGIFGVTLDGKKGFVDIYGNEYFDF